MKVTTKSLSNRKLGELKTKKFYQVWEYKKDNDRIWAQEVSQCKKRCVDKYSEIADRSICCWLCSAQEEIKTSGETSAVLFAVLAGYIRQLIVCVFFIFYVQISLTLAQ